MDFKSQDVLYGWRCGILGSALCDGSSAEMLRSEEQQESFVACLYYSVFNLLYGGVCSAGDQAKCERIFHSGGVGDLLIWGWLGSLVFSAVCFQVWVQETRSNILNAGTLLFSMLCAKLCLDALASSQAFNLFFFSVSLDSVYNTIVPFPVPGNADF